MNCAISIVIPVYNGADTLSRCLDSVARAAPASLECIVVDDGSTDGSAEIAREAGVRVITLPECGGPALARNIGALAATGEVVLFIDADVCIHLDTLAKVTAVFAEDPSLTAVIGSYDFEPGASNFLSQYKNLFHSFVHQHARREANTFWTGCGAIRREFFLNAGGFGSQWNRPSIEDIEFGGVIRGLGGRIRLDPSLQVTHLKRWTFTGLLRTDIFDRAIPWTQLVLRSGSMPNDLNLRIEQRLCVAMVCLCPILALRFPLLACALLLVVAAINLPLYRFFAGKRGLVFAVRAIPLHLLYFWYSGVAMVAGIGLHVLGRLRTEPAPALSEAAEYRATRQT